MTEKPVFAVVQFDDIITIKTLVGVVAFNVSQEKIDRPTIQFQIGMIDRWLSGLIDLASKEMDDV